MKVKIKDIEIECTVDEYEELVVRGLLGDEPKTIINTDTLTIQDDKSDNSQLDDWMKLLKKYEPKKKDPWSDMVVTAYGCEMPYPQISIPDSKLTAEIPVGPLTATTTTTKVTTDDNKAHV